MGKACLLYTSDIPVVGGFRLLGQLKHSGLVFRNVAVILPHQGFKPVSYTHLDVYKRQIKSGPAKNVKPEPRHNPDSGCNFYEKPCSCLLYTSMTVPRTTHGTAYSDGR